MNFSYYLSPYLKINGTQLFRLKIEPYIDSGVSVEKIQWDDKRKKVKRHSLEEKLKASLDSLIVPFKR